MANSTGARSRAKSRDDKLTGTIVQPFMATTLAGCKAAIARKCSDPFKRLTLGHSNSAITDRSYRDPRIIGAQPVILFKPWEATAAVSNGGLFEMTDSTDLDGTESAFRKLADKWKQETAHLSSDHEMSMHPAYQRIIGMGPAVVPSLLAELKRDPNHWFWALRSITGENPVSENARGRLDAMITAWLDWGRSRGYTV